MRFLICLAIVLVCAGQTSAILDFIAKLFEQVKMPGKQVKLLGCFKDELDGCMIPGWGRCAVAFPGRAIKGGAKQYTEDTVVKKCLEDAIRNGVDTFAIQDGKFCYANDKNARNTYNKYGHPFIAPFCLFGRGGLLTNDVYQITKAEPTPPPETTPKPAPLPKCTFSDGDGSGGSEVKVGSKKGAECVRMCVEEKKKDNRINGVTYRKAGTGGTGCYCEIQMTGIQKTANKKKLYKTCFLDDKIPPPPAPEPVEHEKQASGRCESVSKEDCRKLSKYFYNNKVMKEGTKTYGKYPAGCYVVTSSGQVAFNADKDKKGASCSAARNCLCSKNEFAYAAWKDKKCSGYWSEGCHAEKSSFKRADAKLLIYWRHDIEWARNRRGPFGQSLVCACSAAAKKAGMPMFAIHYWGECWGVNGRDMSSIGGGDCVRANFARGMCQAGGSHVCLADKNFMVYANVVAVA